jgi:very-short-patch-repair endonuclease
METRLRLILIGAGLPDPAVNEWVRDGYGAPIHRPDLSWPQWKVALDYDGRHHRERDDEESVWAGQASDWRQRQDESRRDLLGDHGWAYRVFSSFDVFRRADVVVERVRLLLRRAGAPV